MSDLDHVVNATTDGPDLGLAHRDVLIIFVLWGVVLPLVAAAGLVGNALTMLVLWRREMNSTTILYMRALVITDTGILLGSVLTLTPIACADYLKGQALMYFKHSVYPVLRTPAYYVIMTLQQINVWVTVSVSVERYVAICHPFRASRLITRRNTVKLVFCLTAISVVYNLPRVFAYRTVSCEDAMSAGDGANLSTPRGVEIVSDIQIETTERMSPRLPSTTAESKEPDTLINTVPVLHPLPNSTSYFFMSFLRTSSQSSFMLSSTPSISLSRLSSSSSPPPSSLSTTTAASLVSPSVAQSTYSAPMFSSSSPLVSSATSPTPSSLSTTSATISPAEPCLDVVTTEFGKTDFYKFYRTIMYLIIIYVLPFLPLLVLNGFLFRELMSMQKRKVPASKQEDNEANLSLVLVLIVIVFIFCQTPGLISQFDLIPSSLFIPWLAFSNFLFATNSAVNFLIYTAFGRRFRRVLLRVFRHLCSKASSNNIRRASSTRFSHANTQIQDCEASADLDVEMTSFINGADDSSKSTQRRGERKQTVTKVSRKTSMGICDPDHVTDTTGNGNACHVASSVNSLPLLATNSTSYLPVDNHQTFKENHRTSNIP
ncbi:FMRFamide receptor [Elysia marginata]|uniref:FMRFamide receptor n=1 Tax=Elysia marginata TaxID=1093978 RepID=A0AAV4EH24_9GAST|nr:FMRFamide receptor [Elysia marginata]